MYNTDLPVYVIAWCGAIILIVITLVALIAAILHVIVTLRANVYALKEMRAITKPFNELSKQIEEMAKQSATKP